jgi:hypothetical protein
MRISRDGAAFVERETAAELPVAPRHSVERGSPNSFERVVRGLGAAIDRGDGLMERAAHAQYATLDAGQLIALQAGIYRYSEAVDLTGKLVDRLTGAAKTVLEGGR